MEVPEAGYAQKTLPENRKGIFSKNKKTSLT